MNWVEDISSYIVSKGIHTTYADTKAVATAHLATASALHRAEFG